MTRRSVTFADAPGAGDAPPDAVPFGSAGSDGISRCATPSWSASNTYETLPDRDNITATWSVDDDQTSCGGSACLDETVYVCTSGSWYAVANVPAGGSGVQSSFDTRFAFSEPVIWVDDTYFLSLTATFTEVSPHDATGSSSAFGAYAAAFDISLGSNDDNEIIVWVDTNGFAPGSDWTLVGSDIVASNDSGSDQYAFDVYADGSATTYWVPEQSFSSGQIDLLGIMWETSDTLGRFDGSQPSGALKQIQFGWELNNTNGSAETFYLDQYAIAPTYSAF